MAPTNISQITGSLQYTMWGYDNARYIQFFLVCSHNNLHVFPFWYSSFQLYTKWFHTTSLNKWKLGDIFGKIMVLFFSARYHQLYLATGLSKS